MSRILAALSTVALASALAVAAPAGAADPTDTVPPTVPSGLRLQVNCSLVVTLSWTASTDNVGVTGYDVFRAPGSGTNGTFVQVGTTTTTTFSENLTNIFRYEVRARDAAGNTSEFTAPLTAVPPPCPAPDTQPPTMPGTPTATVTCGSATLTWSASTDNYGVVAYEVWTAPGPSGTTFTQTGTTTTTSFILNGPGMVRVEVRARDAAGNTSPFTTPVQVTIPACPTDVEPPTTPGTPTATAVTTTTVALAWTASTDNVGVTGYEIYRALGSGPMGLVGTSASTTFTDTGLSPATTYRYSLRARDAAGNTSQFSPALSVRTGSGGGCSATLTLQSAWATGYVMQPNAVTNSGTTTLNGWTVTFTLPAGHTITNAWNATVTVSGQVVTARGIPGQNATLAPGATTTWGFQATRADGDTTAPSSGVTCTSP